MFTDKDLNAVQSRKRSPITKFPQPIQSVTNLKKKVATPTPAIVSEMQVSRKVLLADAINNT